MNIVGILVQFRPEKLASIQTQIIAQGGEVHASSVDGKMVVTLEHDDDNVIADSMEAMQNIDGVLTASLAYQHYDPQIEELTL